ncbi:transglutaminase-like domain-containing protein [Vibrio sp. DW001]|uniref:transglutaminase-like domain-containing protein n=1 Tax=Vibrio sp. DW001 TaxID=2912315 RepID=UPI0023B1059D|nr:transglutaminase-like domain-containing protein [Vibrio sp. DW001]WED29423.1 transglutaminase-like domain-containing protein [Vibrio sp. DW001]
MVLVRYLVSVGTILTILVYSSFSFADDINNKSEFLESYRSYGYYTDPQLHSRAFDGLPTNVEKLCALTKAQFIHPITDLPKYRSKLPVSRRENEDKKYASIAMILEELYKRDPQGLTEDRSPENRLIMSCRSHALLLASILKSQGVPVRLRYGFATYLYSGRFIYHVVCEVWSNEEQRWILVDPDRELYDLSGEDFILAGSAWQMYLNGDIDPDHFGVPKWWGAHVILDVLSHDMAAVLGVEHLYWVHPSLYSYSSMGISKVPEDEMKVIHELSLLLGQPAIDVKKLQVIYEQHEWLQFPEPPL